MASKGSKFDCIIFGGGLAGSVLAWTLINNGKRPLVIDAPSKSRCSQVAAGIINPIGGRRLNLVWNAATQIPFAIRYYRELENRFSASLFHELPIARFFSDRDEEAAWAAKRKLPEYIDWTAPLSSKALPTALNLENQSGFLSTRSGFVDMPKLLGVLRSALLEHSSLIQSEFRYEDISISTDIVRWNTVEAPIAIFAEGHLGTSNPWFQNIPYKPAKGVIGTIETDIDFLNTIIIQKYFLVPRQDGTTLVGATYNWNDRSDRPDEAGIAELERFLNARLGSRWQWIEKKAGVRPATAGAKPAVGPHPEHENLYCFNGFGSKGATQCPSLALALFDSIWRSIPLSPKILPSRFNENGGVQSKRWIAVEIARDRILSTIQSGDSVIDATTGNGHDTLWLSNAVGPSGHVYAFDIQCAALEIAKNRLIENDLDGRVSFLHSCHSQLKEYLPQERSISAVVFNLGYLPQGDKSVTTRAKTTLQALTHSLPRLRAGGMISVVLYPGRPEGDRETSNVLKWVSDLDDECFSHELVENPNKNPKSPIIVFIKRNKRAASHENSSC